MEHVRSKKKKTVEQDNEKCSLYSVACDLETSIIPYSRDRLLLIYNAIHIVFFCSLFRFITYSFDIDNTFKVMFGGYSLICWALILWGVCRYTNEAYIYLRQRIINFYIIATIVMNIFLYFM